MELKLKNINKSYGDNMILSDINIDIKKGELMSILGPSGVGKTTILNIIAGLTDADSGNVILNDDDITNVLPENRGVSYVFQSPLLFPHMNVIENICFGLDIRKKSKKFKEKTSKRLLDSLGISGLSDRMPYELSGGEQQRVSIARALAVEPKILLMDEPFSNLDPELRENMGLLIKEIQKEFGQTILFVTHDRNESMVLSNRIAIMLDGGLKQIGSPKDIYYFPKTKEVATFMGTSNLISGDSLLELSKEFEFIEYKKDLSLFLRPHQIEIKRKDEGYIIKDMIFNGKEIRYNIVKENIYLNIEEFSDRVLNIGDGVGIIIQNKALHYI